MACTPTRRVRVEPELLMLARLHPGLADASPSTLIRIGLARLAGLDLSIPELRSLYGDRSHAPKTSRAKQALS